MTVYALSEAIKGAWEGETPPEQNLIEWSAQLMDPTKLFVDIGAHVGSWGLQYAVAGANVVAFEATWDTYTRLVAGIFHNNISARIKAHYVALGDGLFQQVPIRSISADGGGNSTAFLSTHEDAPVTEIVQCRTLDSYRLRNVGLIKVDVEGAELAVLQGALQTLALSNYPKIILESWRESRMPEAKELREDLFGFLKGLGYRLIQIGAYDEIFLAERVPNG